MRQIIHPTHILLSFLGVRRPPDSAFDCALKVCRAAKRKSAPNEIGPLNPGFKACSVILSTPGMCDVHRSFEYYERAREACLDIL